MAVDIIGQKIEVGDAVIFPTDTIKSVYSGIFTGTIVQARVHRIEELHDNFSYLEIVLAPGQEYALDREDDDEGLVKIFSNVVTLITKKGLNQENGIRQTLKTELFGSGIDFKPDEI